jgi:hypothetical protein
MVSKFLAYTISFKFFKGSAFSLNIILKESKRNEKNKAGKM